MDELTDEVEVKEYIESRYTVPNVKTSSKDGDIFIEFSDKVKPIYFEELAAKFLNQG